MDFKKDFKKYISPFLFVFLLFVPRIQADDPPQYAGEQGEQIVPAIQAAAPWDEGWYTGADGYAKALKAYEKGDKSMAVYVKTAWCPYCRTFEKQVLSDPKVKAYMKDIIKVHLDPESGKRENSIAFQYGVMGFPSFYVHPPQPSGTVRLYTGVTPGQFIDLLKKVLT